MLPVWSAVQDLHRPPEPKVYFYLERDQLMTTMIVGVAKGI